MQNDENKKNKNFLKKLLTNLKKYDIINTERKREERTNERIHRRTQILQSNQDNRRIRHLSRA